MKQNFYTFLFFLFLTFAHARFFNYLYHTNEEIYQKLDTLANTTCSKILSSQLLVEPESNNSIKFYTLSTGAGLNKNKVFMLFGEHAREIISAELGLNIITSLCDSQTKNKSFYSKQTLNAILSQNDFVFIPILNAYGRTKVVEGNFCQRANENGVDINRNYDNHWFKSSIKEISSGTKSFSEWETRVVKILLEQTNPNVFISTHSGETAMFMPFGYKKVPMEEYTQELKDSYEMLSKLSDKYCQCPYGSIADKLAYSAKGSEVDYAYESMGVKYAFAFEIYKEEKNKYFKKLFKLNRLLPFDINKFNKRIFLQTNNKLKKAKNDEVIYNENEEESVEYQFSECIKKKNPLEKSNYEKILINWTNAYFELLSMIYNKENK